MSRKCDRKITPNFVSCCAYELVNGARGEVVNVVSDNGNALTHFLVKFDHPNVGIKAKLCSQFGQQYLMAVPLKRHEAIFLTKDK